MSLQFIPKLRGLNRVHFIALGLVACAGFSTLAVNARNWFAPPVPVQTPAPAAAEGYVRRARLWPQLREVLNALGDRVERPGKERLTLTGLISRPTVSKTEQNPARLFLELPDKLRLEEQTGLQTQVTVFNGSSGQGVVKTGGAAEQEDEDLVESFVYDAADHFLNSRTRGRATRFPGSRFRADDGATADYKGPYYDLYELTELVQVGKEARRQTKLYYFNSDTLLLERVSYELSRTGAPVRVEVRYRNWQKISGQQIPGEITRLEKGGTVLKLSVTGAAIGPQANDGLFGSQSAR
jgi:hypothetical protein